MKIFGRNGGPLRHVPRRFENLTFFPTSERYKRRVTGIGNLNDFLSVTALDLCDVGKSATEVTPFGSRKRGVVDFGPNPRYFYRYTVKMDFCGVVVSFVASIGS